MKRKDEIKTTTYEIGCGFFADFIEGDDNEFWTSYLYNEKVGIKVQLGGCYKWDVSFEENKDIILYDIVSEVELYIEKRMFNDLNGCEKREKTEEILEEISKERDKYFNIDRER